MTNEKQFLGTNISKLYQGISLGFTLFFISFLLLIQTKLEALIIMSLGLMLMNYLWFAFSDIKFDDTYFSIEKLFFSKKIPRKDFKEIRRLFLFIFTIEFKNEKRLFWGPASSLFTANFEKILSNRLRGE